MTYIISTNSPGDEVTFRKVGDLVENKPDGLVALYAGASGDGLSVIAVWDSRAQADRLAAEQLVPALRQLGVQPDGPRAMISSSRPSRRSSADRAPGEQAGGWL